MAKFGIDVSEHQGVIEWDKVKSQIDFAILRVGWIGNKENHTIDTQFERNYNECKRLGISVGAYVYNYCENAETAKSGAKWCLKQLQNKEFELPIFLDMEDKQIENLSKDELTNIIYSFNYEIEKQGFSHGVYANLNWFKNKLDLEVIKKRSYTWIAHYVKGTNKYENEYNIWQNSSSGKIDGIDGNVDTNYLYNLEITKNEILSIEEIAQKVINGDYGNGEERKINLENDGYNYEEVQNRVNIILNTNKYFKSCSNSQNSIVDGLKEIGVDSSFISRKAIATKNAIFNYSGTASENIKLLNLLKTGKLLK